VPAGRVVRLALVALGLAGLLIPAVATASPAHLSATAQVSLYQGSCAYSFGRSPGQDSMTVCVWDAVGDPDTLPVTGGPERTVNVHYFYFTCDPTCSTTEDQAQVPARDVTFDPGMTGVHVHTDMNGCHVDLDETGLNGTPSTPIALLDPPYLKGPAHVDGTTVLQAYDGGTSGMVRSYKTIVTSVCGHAASAALGYDTSGYGALYLTTNAWLDAQVPDDSDSVCADGTVLWYWHPNTQGACLPPS
jgi:hypothetical protein